MRGHWGKSPLWLPSNMVSAGCPARGGRAVHSLWDQLLTQAFWAVSSMAHYFWGLWTAGHWEQDLQDLDRVGAIINIRISTLIWSSRGIHTTLYIREQWPLLIYFIYIFPYFIYREDRPSSYSMYQQREVSPIFPDRHQIHDSTALSNILKCPQLLTRNVTVTAHKERENVLIKKQKQKMESWTAVTFVQK